MRWVWWTLFRFFLRPCPYAIRSLRSVLLRCGNDPFCSTSIFGVFSWKKIWLSPRSILLVTYWAFVYSVVSLRVWTERHCCWLASQRSPALRLARRRGNVGHGNLTNRHFLRAILYICSTFYYCCSTGPWLSVVPKLLRSKMWCWLPFYLLLQTVNDFPISLYDSCDTTVL